MVLPDNILAFKLLKASGLSNEERLLVMTGIDFSKTTEMYEDAKKSLRKFKGSGVGGYSGDSVAIKVEPAFYSSPTYRKTGWRGGKGGGQVGFAQRDGVAQREKEINPVGRDGRIMRCNKCNSIRHLFIKCPHNSSFTCTSDLG